MMTMWTRVLSLRTGTTRSIRSLRNDQQGSVLVEFTIILSLLLTLTLGFVDFSAALYQWNSATKAVERGARLAAVSNPVASGITALSGVSGTVNPGDAMPAFEAVCNGSTGSCACTGALATCTYSATAMSDIVFGRGKTVCGAIGADGTAAMCDMFQHIGATLTSANVIVTYTNAAASGLGFAGRPGGAVAMVKVEVTGLPFNFFFLNGLLGFPTINMPPLTTTVTGEDLSSTAS